MERNEIRRKRYEREYFRRQKIYGVMVALFGLAVVAFGEGWEWANLRFMGDVVTVFGLYVSITQNKLIS